MRLPPVETLDLHSRSSPRDMQHHSAVIPRLQLSVHEIAQEVAKKSTKKIKDYGKTTAAR